MGYSLPISQEFLFLTFCNLRWSNMASMSVFELEFAAIPSNGAESLVSSIAMDGDEYVRCTRCGYAGCDVRISSCGCTLHAVRIVSKKFFICIRKISFAISFNGKQSSHERFRDKCFIYFSGFSFGPYSNISTSNFSFVAMYSIKPFMYTFVLSNLRKTCARSRTVPNVL